jgi:YggT family protein
MAILVQILYYLLNVLWWLIIISAVLSLLFGFNVLNYSNTGARGFRDGLDRLLEPLYRPFRKLLPPTGGIDWSPFLVLVIIGVLQIVLLNIPTS